MDSVLDNSNHIFVTKKQVYKAIFSFPRASVSGIDELKPQYLKEHLGKTVGAAGNKLLVSLINLCNIMLAGSATTEFLPFIYGAYLIALGKKYGGIRPISVGSTIRSSC
ncbi:hypothetical protein ILUMI_12092 [Ignelater luminosus]|uniref:Uncharacterized protein n=1 Tax=Ignelater luminosus TaxID=2038154 RepID=A0A8K0D0Y7_IGNLU|nr:hypothetical protein ILUMI_12092 [Ignelater luminosus]